MKRPRLALWASLSFRRQRYEIVDGFGADGDQFAILDNDTAAHLDARFDTRAEAKAALAALKKGNA